MNKSRTFPSELHQTQLFRQAKRLRLTSKYYQSCSTGKVRDKHMRIRFSYLTFFVLPALFLLAGVAEGATLFLVPEKSAVAPGESFIIDLKLDTKEVSINATQAKITFPSNILTLQSVDKESSIFNFWLEEPTIQNEQGTMQFIGGTTKGISGSALQILKLKFKASGSGEATLSLSDATVAANDGKGTNVLSEMAGTIIKIGIVSTTPAPAPATEVKEPAAIEQPKKVEREPVPAAGLPAKPVLRVPLYPDPLLWYNHLGEVTVFWNLPDDIIQVATALDQSPKTSPENIGKELFTGKSFGVLKDGVWYAHIQFKNNIGWGPIAHYRIAIDTQPPRTFDIEIPEGEATDNPAPTLIFTTSDAFSGLKEYQMRINEGEVISLAADEFKGSFQLPLQAPGTKQIVVKAVDFAGNSAEDAVELEILPIASPKITFVTRNLFSDAEEGLTVKGTALPNIAVLLSLFRESALAVQQKVISDERGNWEFTFEKSLRNGRYKLTAQSQDVRGALSLVVESPEIRIKSKPIIQIGKFQLGMGGALIFLLFVVASGFVGGFWFYKTKQEKLALRVAFSETEVAKVFKLIQDDLKKIEDALMTPTDVDEKFILNKLRESIKKMEIYLRRGVEKIKK